MFQKDDQAGKQLLKYTPETGGFQVFLNQNEKK